MAKQLIKGLTMLLLIMAVALVSAVASSAYGQSSRHDVATIPFEFVVGDKTLPAGEYAVTGLTSNGEVLRVQSMEQNKSALRLSSTITRNTSSDKGKLVFRRYGEQYFLAEVWSAGDMSGRQLSKSKQERAKERELASIPNKSDWAQSGYELVEIAAVSH